MLITEHVQFPCTSIEFLSLQNKFVRTKLFSYQHSSKYLLLYPTEKTDLE